MQTSRIPVRLPAVSIVPVTLMSYGMLLFLSQLVEVRLRDPPLETLTKYSPAEDKFIHTVELVKFSSPPEAMWMFPVRVRLMFSQG